MFNPPWRSGVLLVLFPRLRRGLFTLNPLRGFERFFEEELILSGL